MNSFILLKEEKERIQKLYEATTAASSGQFNQPMAFTEPIELDMETTVVGGDNIEADSLELTLDIEELSDLLNIGEDEDLERMRMLHRTNSVVEEQIEKPEVSIECLSCFKKSLKGERKNPMSDYVDLDLGTYDYTEEVDTIIAAVINGMGGGKPTIEEITKILTKLAFTIPKMSIDGVFIAQNLYENGCMGSCVSV
tara:strand:- start:15758 stop:16348 length:591 start_codon:yes stop_codon:yes gene_type:complete